MISTNDIICNSIMNIMKQNNKKYDELADYLGISKTMIGKLLSGSRVINAMELKKIAEFLNVSKESLVKIPQTASETNTVNSLIGKAHSKEAKEGLA